LIYVDSSFWVALRIRRDRHHSEARELYRSHADAGLVTSNHVRGETWTYLRRKVGHGGAVGFLDSIERSPRLQIVRIEAKQEAEALLWLRQHDEREYSFVDASGFALMRSMRIREVLAFDGDYAAAGFVELRP
jgi:predicted nucleic acid-binding protein